MRSREFTINVPITITINGDEDPQISAGPQDSTSDVELQQNPVMVTPQQQELELKKAELGKTSPIIDKLTEPQSIGAEPPDNQILARLKDIISR